MRSVRSVAARRYAALILPILGDVCDPPQDYRLPHCYQAVHTVTCFDGPICCFWMQSNFVTLNESKGKLMEISLQNCDFNGKKDNTPWQPWICLGPFWDNPVRSVRMFCTSSVATASESWCVPDSWVTQGNSVESTSLVWKQAGVSGIPIKSQFQ